MRNTTKWMGIGCVGALLLSAAGAKASPINLVTNGGFEEGAVGYGAAAGWSFAAGPLSSSAGVGGDSGLMHSGEHYYYFAAPGLDGEKFDTLSQEIPTTPGAQYTLTFFAEHTLPGYGYPYFAAWWGGIGGTVVESSYSPTDIGMDVYGKVTRTVIGGPGETTTLTFEGFAGGGGGFFLDDVSVTPVPEPAVLSLAALGGLMLLQKRRRR